MGTGTAQDPLRQNHAPHPAQDRGERTGPVGRYVHAGRSVGGRVSGGGAEGEVMESRERGTGNGECGSASGHSLSSARSFLKGRLTVHGATLFRSPFPVPRS